MRFVRRLVAAEVVVNAAPAAAATSGTWAIHTAASASSQQIDAVALNGRTVPRLLPDSGMEKGRGAGSAADV